MPVLRRSMVVLRPLGTRPRPCPPRWGLRLRACFGRRPPAEQHISHMAHSMDCQRHQSRVLVCRLLWQSWQKPELPHQAKSICNSPVLNDLAILKAAYVYDGDSKRLTCGRSSHERPLMGATTCNTCPSLITAGDNLIDGQFQIGEGCAQADNCPLHAFYIRGHETILMFREVGGKEFIQGGPC